MDTVKSIEEQIVQIRELSPSLSLERVLVHLERAELHYKNGKDSGDENYFTDVVYRTNQAFEGSLRQSYGILADKTEEETRRLRTVDIEDFFESESIFNERVLHFFRNYRKEWRNKSTHDHQLFFDENEAYLAIMNVSAYIHVLLDQIIVKLAYLNEQQRILNEKVKRHNALNVFQSEQKLVDRIVDLIKIFSENNESIKSSTSEGELIGMFCAFLNMASEEVEVETEVKIENGGRTKYLDMLVSLGDEKVIIEIKRPQTYSKHGEDQLVEYLEATDLFEGILWYPASVPSEKFLTVRPVFNIFGENVVHTTTIKEYDEDED